MIYDLEDRMKKSSKFLLTIFMLLILSLIISSCNNGIGDISGNDTLPETPSEAVTSENVAVPPEATSDDITSEVITTEEVTTEEVTTEEITTEEVTTEEVTTKEVTTEEVTTEEVTTEEVTTEEVTTEEVTAPPAPHEHLWSAWKVVKASGCTEQGSETRECTCGEKEIRTVPALGHVNGRWITAKKETCTSEGVRHRICSRCTAILLTESIPVKDHDYGAWVILNYASCTESGARRKTCSGCTKTVSENIPAKGHSEGKTVTTLKATCTSDGWIETVCSDCGDVLSAETVKAYGHTEGRTITASKVTCTSDGLNHVICSVCTLIIRYETVAATGHIESDWQTVEELSSEEISVKQKKCVSCGIVMAEKKTKSAVLLEAERVAEAVNSVKGNNSFSFAALSDTHVSVDPKGWLSKQTKKSAQFAARSLRLLGDLIDISAAALLGDYSDSGGNYTIDRIKEDFAYVRDCFSDLGDYPVAWIRGNHEINYHDSSERPTTNEELYEYIDSNSHGLIVDPDNPKGGYGYFDLPEQKIRMIFLNTSDVYTEYAFFEGYDAPSVGVSSAQLRWLAGTALDFSDKSQPSEWGIIVFSHIPLNYMPSAVRVLALLEAYRDGKSGTLSYKEEGKNYSVEYDFSSARRAEIICSIHGHSHNYKYEKISSSAKVEPWLWRICIPCVNVGRENECATSTNSSFAEKWGEFDENGDPVYYRKAIYDPSVDDYIYNEDNGTSYCIFTIDRDTKMIYVHYVGVGTDRVVSYAG